jgi:hypothetical protein
MKSSCSIKQVNKVTRKLMMRKFVHMREYIIHKLLGISTQEVLNRPPVDTTIVPLDNIAQEMKKAVNTFKSLAMDDVGLQIDYGKLRDSQEYAMYKKEFSPQLYKVDLQAFQSEKQKIAFWLNVYNALVIDAVIAYGVKTSVTEGFLGIVRFFRKAAYNIGGLRFSLEDIEHGVLRANRGNPFVPGPQFSSTDNRIYSVLDRVDPRIHFALNCASRSCPPISVYQEDGLDAQLDLAARNFLDQEVHLDKDAGALYISALFKWFDRDFGRRTGILKFLHAYLPKDERHEWLHEQGIVSKIKYLPYDWALNV